SPTRRSFPTARSTSRAFHTARTWRRRCEAAASDRWCALSLTARTVFWERHMNHAARRILPAAAIVALVISSAFAQQATRGRGTIETLDGNMLMVKARDGATLHVMLTNNAQVIGVVKATLADIKEGAFIGSGAVPQADGSQKAVEVHIFPESMR